MCLSIPFAVLSLCQGRQSWSGQVTPGTPNQGRRGSCAHANSSCSKQSALQQTGLNCLSTTITTKTQGRDTHVLLSILTAECESVQR